LGEDNVLPLVLVDARQHQLLQYRQLLLRSHRIKKLTELRVDGIRLLWKPSILVSERGRVYGGALHQVCSSDGMKRVACISHGDRLSDG
jgi:hypothetical protein